MNIILKIIIAVLLIYLLNILFLSVYCRIERKIDSMVKQKTKNSNQKTEEIKNSKSSLKERKLVNALKTFYKNADHYFYGWMRYCQMRMSKYPSNRIRKILYKRVFCMDIDKKTVISAGCEIRSPWNVHMGNCIIAGNCIIDGRSGIIIEDNVVLGMNVHIWTQEHDVNSPSFAVTPEHRGEVVIGERAWVCSDSTILPGVKIGEGAVIAAKALVCKNCEPYGIYGGVSAKKISDRTRNLTYVLSGKPHWHFN